MIVYKKGDIIQALKSGEIDILAHGCNLSGGFGSGIAGQIAKEFPQVRDAYFEEYSSFNLSEVQWISWIENLNKNQYILNCFTQENFGPGKRGSESFKKYVSYDAIDKVFAHISDETLSERIGIPKIGAGLGGGNWTIIEAIINSHFPDREIYVYTFDIKDSK